MAENNARAKHEGGGQLLDCKLFLEPVGGGSRSIDGVFGRSFDRHRRGIVWLTDYAVSFRFFKKKVGGAFVRGGIFWHHACGCIILGACHSHMDIPVHVCRLGADSSVCGCHCRNGNRLLLKYFTGTAGLSIGDGGGSVC